MFPVLEFSFERGRLTSPDRPDRVPNSIRFAVDGGYSGPEYFAADILPGPESLLDLRQRCESSIIRAHPSTENANRTCTHGRKSSPKPL